MPSSDREIPICGLPDPGKDFALASAQFQSWRVEVFSSEHPCLRCPYLHALFFLKKKSGVLVLYPPLFEMAVFLNDQIGASDFYSRQCCPMPIIVVRYHYSAVT